jgi:hypothetical protein
VHSIHSLAELHGSANGKLMEHAPLPAKYASADEPITGMLRTRCTAHRALVPDVFDFKGVVHTHGAFAREDGPRERKAGSFSPCSCSCSQ